MSGDSGSSIEVLIAACQEGSDRAWRDLLERISPLVLAICRESRLSAEESLDVFGQVCYLLVRNIGQIRNPDKGYAYVATITRRQIFNRFHKDRGLEFIDNEQLGEAPADAKESPDRQYEETQQRFLLLKALAALPARDYELLTALFFEEQEPSYDEIAARLRMPVASIGPTRARALKKLERLLKRMGYKFDVF